ncbi:MAG: response regulator [Treponema sp.]|jgi:two-component system response regulator YesN|nr:response regulator [Treponema sp.]
MYKLILVDDEPWALKGLSEIIPWNEYGFEICGYCGNAAEALAAFRENNADAVFTDIRMPGTSGVELIAEIKKIKPEVECVIISAYSDFEAARKALEYQASAYILKPLEENEVRKTAARARASLDNRTANTHSLLITGAESLMCLLPKIEQAITPGWCYAVLYSGEIPYITANQVEIILGGASVKAAFFSVSAKADSPGGHGQDNLAFSRRHEGCGNALEMLREASVSGCGGFAWANHFTISEIQYYVARHYRNSFSLDDLAARFYISENYLGELFKKHTGDTIVNFIRSVRMENAGRFLKYTDTPLKEVAWECGFPDISYFGRNFKNYFGVTPARFRNIADVKYRRPDFFIPWLQ